MLDFLATIFSFLHIINFPIWEMWLFMCNDNHQIEIYSNLDPMWSLNCCVCYELEFELQVVDLYINITKFEIADPSDSYSEVYNSSLGGYISSTRWFWWICAINCCIMLTNGEVLCFQFWFYLLFLSVLSSVVYFAFELLVDSWFFTWWCSWAHFA